MPSATAPAPSSSWLAPASAAEPLALYIHWPFCAKKCPYCDFNSHVRVEVDHTAWREALLRELRQEAALVPNHRLVSIFFGGGTPSLMPPATVAALIDTATGLWPHGEVEITLEANPSSVEADAFAAFAAAGVNRVSLGVQSLDDAALRFLGRLHGAAEALAALDVAQRHFARVSFDLIYARPEQSLADWQGELARALSFGTSHLSLYQLTIEPNTGFAGRYARGEFSLPDEDASAALFALTQEMTAAAGLPAYEISNHARPGAESRHNQVYWTYGDYLGIGPGAHGRRLGAATTRRKRPEAWLAAVRDHGDGIDTITPLDPASRAEEALLMGLRLASGIDAAAFARRTGRPLIDGLDARRLARAVDGGFIRWDGQTLAATASGWPLLNSLIGDIVA
jgi:putative oxygen-independent coproporphyrinogen III oxidase